MELDLAEAFIIVFASIVSSSVSSYVASWRGTQNAIKDHGERLVAAETTLENHSQRIERVEDRLFPAR